MRQRSSILLKIVSAIVGMLVIGTAASVVFTVRSERSNLLEATQRTLSVNTDLLLNTIQNLMLSGEAPILVRAMRSYQTIEGFTEISLYRANGEAAFSDYTTIDDVNGFQKKIHFERTPRSPVDTEDDPNLARAVKGRTLVQAISTQEQSIEYFFPIINLTDCRQCHGRSGFVRGVLHLKLSLASVFDQIRSARDTLALLLGSIGVVIALLLVLLINRLIVAPVLAIGGTVRLVGQGDLDARVNLRSRDELGVLGTALNEMIAGLRERNELAIRNRVIDTRNKENRKYLDSIQEGLILLDRRFMISEQYSLYLERLFGTTDIAGKNFIDFVYPDASAQQERRGVLEQFLDILFTRTSSEMEMIMEINPLKDVTLVTGPEDAKREIIVDTLYHRIVEEGQVVNVMVIFSDRTDLVRTRRDLEREKERSETELAHIASMLRAGPAAFQEFVDQAEQTISELESGMGDLAPGARLDSLFRAVHSLKGAARYLEFRAIERSAHEGEQSLAAIRDGTASAGPTLTVRLKEMTQTIRAEIAVVRDLIQRFRQFSVTPGAQEGGGGSGAAAVLIDSLRSMATNIAGELGKEVNFRASGRLESAELARALRDPLIHLVRNAVDHGVEDPMERIAAGKDRTGTVSLLFARREGQIVVRVTDDGAGIDFQAIGRRARELGLVAADAMPSNAELTRILFSPRFSSKGEPSAISGRGVGLDIVREGMQKLGGKIAVTTRKGEGTSFTLSIPS